MIINLLILSSVLGIGYQNWRAQKQLYNKKLILQQKQYTKRLKENKTEEKLVTSPVNERRTTKDLIYTSVAISFASVGYLVYSPLSWFAAPFMLFAMRRKLYITWELLKKGKIDVETLSTMTILGAIIGQHFFIGSLLSFISTLGDILTSRVLRDSHHQLIDIYQDIPKKVWLLKDNIEIFVPLSEIRAGDVLVVGAGELIPADGQIVWGVAGIDEHRFTGESMPVEKSQGDKVFAMTIVLSGKIHFLVEKAGAETSATKIAEVLNQTSDYKSLSVLKFEAFSRQLVKPALISSLVALPLFGFESAVAVLFVHPKERLKIAGSLSLSHYLKQSMDEGILIKDGRSLDLLSQVDTIIFDKTGTLTEEQPHVGNIYSFSEYVENEILQFAVIAEHKQTHPLARAILKEAKQRDIAFYEPKHSEYRLGYGVKVTIKEKTITVGSYRFMTLENIDIPESVKYTQETARQQGHSLIMIAIDKQLVGAIELLPTIRPEAKATIQKLKQLAQIKKIYIISGDAETPTAHLAKELNIDHYFAHTLPQQKAEIIEKLQQEGHFICYIGDGINDAIAMKQAQVSISLNGASQLATDTAQILLLDQGIQHLPRLFELAQGFNHHMNVQQAMILVPSIFGIGTIFLTGAGMSGMMVLTMLSLSTSIGYSLYTGYPVVENDKKQQLAHKPNLP